MAKALSEEEREKRVHASLVAGRRWHIEVIIDSEDERYHDELMDQIADLAIGYGQDHGFDAHVSGCLKFPAWHESATPPIPVEEKQ